MKRVNYEILENNDSYILIRDVGPWDVFLSVTNGAEIVVEELKSYLNNNKQLRYIDTEDQTDLLLHFDGKFIGFAPLER